MSRTIVSYDDIVDPIQAPSIGPQPPQPTQPPPKKRKRNNQNQSRAQQQHWDDPGQPSQHMSYGNSSLVTSVVRGDDGLEEGEEEEEESRVLTQEEMWDDSALVDAWESANAEYEAYHGKGKAWKNEPVKKSPLWYNVPPSPSKAKKLPQQNAAPSTSDNVAPSGDDDNSHPLNFNTFVPNHDPTLANPSAAAYQLAESSGEHVSQDEAFNRALSAMYWTGYWTAVYHSHRKPGEGKTAPPQNEEEDGEYVEGGGEDVDDMEEDGLVSTQRG
ncbi:hypothetical protein FA95DRAFT_1556522 [Auriscalpium vulgare]|uniref:Uncharacterized protein n=1 Tax=Auriscalpium vulgare TaxID=40419 RepID=A0ACB8S061_9AGAM|nr:hypothetical protein FA95DRAFT_1556522 [Auriscalpium vulgare]